MNALQPLRNPAQLPHGLRQHIHQPGHGIGERAGNAQGQIVLRQGSAAAIAQANGGGVLGSERCASVASAPGARPAARLATTPRMA